jgi:glycerophosphoryl diester phosphodiesterase
VSDRSATIMSLTLLVAVTFPPFDMFSSSFTGRPDRPLVIAHRGYSAIAPEHTITAYDLAHRAGADYLEQDLQLTSDGVLVVLHDATLDRTARGAPEDCVGPVISRTLDEIRRCSAGAWFNERFPALARHSYAGLRIPTLDEVLSRYGDSARYYIETKNPEEAPGMEEELIRLLRRHGLLGRAEVPPRVIIQSFSPESLRKIRELVPDMFLVQLLEKAPSSELGGHLLGFAEYANGIGPHFSSVDEPLVGAAHALGLVVHPYTVNDPAEMRRLQVLGIDGFFTDQTARALEVVGGGRL